MLVRQADARRFLWGDEESRQVADLVYGRGERLSAVVFTLGPGHWFGASGVWKPLYDQHRFYYVVQGSLTIHDPEGGQVSIAGTGEAITWRGPRYHFGYNFGDEETVVLDWFAPKERPLDVPEVSLSGTKRPLGEFKGGPYEFLGAWPDRRPHSRDHAFESGDIVTVGRAEALNLIQGRRKPLLVSILSSSELLTGGTFRLRASESSEPEQHLGDEILFALTGRLNVLLPESGDWFELRPLDCLFIPEGTLHQYWSYGAESSSAVFCVAPRYR